MLCSLANLTKTLNLTNYSTIEIWVELDSDVLITVDQQESIQQSIGVMLRLYVLRGKSILLSKIVGGASWISRPTKLDLDAMFKGRPSKCQIKFQGVQKASKGKSFTLRSKVYDLDDELSEKE